MGNKNKRKKMPKFEMRKLRKKNCSSIPRFKSQFTKSCTEERQRQSLKETASSCLDVPGESDTSYITLDPVDFQINKSNEIDYSSRNDEQVSSNVNILPGAPEPDTTPQRTKRAAWLKVTKANIKRKRPMVCQLHFASHEIVYNSSRKRVVFDAVPSLRLPGSEDQELLTTDQHDEDMPEVKTEPPDGVLVDLFTEEDTVVQQRTSRRTAESLFRRLDKDDDRRSENKFPVHEAEERFSGLQTLDTPGTSSATDLDLLIKLSRAHLSPELAKIIEIQALLNSELKAAFDSKKYSKMMLYFAVKLYHSYPKTYMLMHHSLCLPSMVKIQQLCRNMSWEINGSWTRMLQARFEHASAEDRECVVSVAKVRLTLGLSYDPVRDRMAGLEERDGVQKPRIARYATVVYARGIRSRWRQPLSYELSPADFRPERLWLWLDAIISALFDIGLNVRALITDFDDDFNPIVRPFGSGKTYFHVKDKQIYCFYDCTQLMVMLCDCFRMYNINFKGMIATWGEIEELYEYDKTRRYKLAPGLSEEHVKPDRVIAARQAKLAVETLSPQVASALAAAVDLRVLGDSAHGTVQLITTFSTLYDVLHNKELAVVGKHINPELRFLHDMLVSFEKITFMDKNEMTHVADPGVLNGFSTDVRSAMALQERMRQSGFDALPMRAFNNDPIHQLFKRLRELNGNKDPTGRQLIDGLRRSFTINILKSFSKDGKLDGFLDAASGVKDVAVEEVKESVFRGLVKPSHIAALTRTGADVPSLLEQCLRLKPCCELGQNFCNFATPLFVEYLNVMERKFRLYFSTDPLGECVISGLVASLSEDQFPAPCNCFPILYLQTLYLRFRITNLVNYNNTKFRKGISRDFTMNLKENAYSPVILRLHRSLIYNSPFHHK